MKTMVNGAQNGNGHHPVAAVDALAEERKAVRQARRPYMIFVSADKFLFSAEGVQAFSAADAVLIDLEESDGQVDDADLHKWIAATYASGKQVYLAATPKRLVQAVQFTSHSVITVAKTGKFAGLGGQRLANKLTDHYEDLVKKIPVDPASLPRRSGNPPRQEWDPVVSLSDPSINAIHYQRVLSIEEEKNFDRLLDEADR